LTSNFDPWYKSQLGPLCGLLFLGDTKVIRSAMHNTRTFTELRPGALALGMLSWDSCASAYVDTTPRQAINKAQTIELTS
jgi:hypothetical protein